MNNFETALLRYLKPEQLALVQHCRIAIAGAGGLGSNIAVILVRTGFKNMEIIDRDVVDLSNLNRQDFTLADVGQPKVECLRRRLLTINPDADIRTGKLEWTPESAAGLFTSAQIIVEAFDRAALKAQFVEYYAAQNPEQIIVSGNGMAGLNTGTSATTLRRIGQVYIVGDGITSIHDGYPPLAPRVIQCAARMAEVVLSLALTGTICTDD